MLTLRPRAALCSALDDHRRTTWCFRGLLPPSCLLFWVFAFVVMRCVAVLVFTFEIDGYIAFWTQPSLGPWSLLTSLTVLTALFGGYVLTEFLVFLSRGERRNLAQWVVFPLAIWCVAMSLLWLSRVAASLARLADTA